ncbi:MAG: FHA domain-containing protein, partial [Candidatus Binatia bacterium]
MADEKKPPDDTEKKRESVPEIDPEQTVLASRKKLQPAPADESDAQSTMMFRRPAEIARPGAAPVEDDRTVVGTAAPRGSLAASARATFQIVVLSGPARGKRFPIEGTEALIGSDPTCDAAVAGIEDVHVKIARRAQGYELQNLGSSGSVTLAGGRQPNRAELSSGDLLKVGPVVLRV